jgi:osmotically-inducible protein OsmY
MAAAGARKSDAQIQQEVLTELQRDPRVEETEVGVQVTDGWVTLEGTVDFWHEREDAERAIRNLASVRGVTNRITAAYAAAEPPQEAVGHGRGVREVEDRLEIDPEA